MRLLRNHKLKLVIGDANSSSILETRVKSHELEDSSPNVHCPPSKLRLIRRRTNKAKPAKESCAESKKASLRTLEIKSSLDRSSSTAVA